MDVSVEIHCAACGSANWGLPGGLADEDPIHCNDCGRTMGSLRGLKDEMLSQAIARSADIQRQEIDRLDGAA